MKKYLIATLVPLVMTLHAQTLKTYTGPYKKGQATYTYYEDRDLNRILQGSFLFTASDNHPATYVGGRVIEKTTIKGTFKDNKEDGIWECKRELLSQANNSAQFYSIAKGKFTDGKRNSEWTYREHGAVNNKAEDFNTSFNFKDDLLVGKIVLGSAKGNLDDQGNFIGNWSFQSAGLEYLAEFEKNIFTKLTVRNISDGSIQFKYECPIDVNNDDNVSPDILSENGYTLIQASSIQNSYQNDVQKKPRSNDNSTGAAYNENANKYFIDFYETLAKAIAGFDHMDNIEVGFVETPIVKSPMVLMITTKKLSDYGRIKESVKIAFQKWLVKGAYESSNGYENRIKAQVDSQFHFILTKVIEDSKANFSKLCIANLADYDPDSERYRITYNIPGRQYDFAYISISKYLAPFLYEKFMKPAYPNIYIMPTEFVMINKNWKMVHAVVFFQDRWYTQNLTSTDGFIFFKSEDKWYYQYSYQHVNRDEVLDFKSHPPTGKYSDSNIYYYDLNLSDSIVGQQINFTYKDLNIEIPKF